MESQLSQSQTDLKMDADINIASLPNYRGRPLVISANTAVVHTSSTERQFDSEDSVVLSDLESDSLSEDERY